MPKKVIKHIEEHVTLYRDTKTGIAWIENGKTGNGHSAYPNIDASGGSIANAVGNTKTTIRIYMEIIVKDFFTKGNFMVFSKGVNLSGRGIKKTVTDDYTYFCTRKAISSIKERFGESVVDERGRGTSRRHHDSEI